MYKPESRIAEEFISHSEILETLEYARENKNNRPLIESLIEKAALCRDYHTAKPPCFWSAKKQT